MVRRQVWVWMAAALFVVGLTSANAATHRVSTLAQLRAAVAAAAPGDTILLADGTYASTETTACTIQDKRDLTIRSASGKRGSVVITGLGQDNEQTQFGFKVNHSPRITIQDLTIGNVYWHCVQVNEGSTRCTLRNLDMWDAGEGPLKVTSPGHKGPYSDSGLVEGCTIGYHTKGTRGVVEGIDIVAAKDWTIRHCRFYNVTKGRDDDVAYGFFAKGNSQGTIVDGCYLEDCDIPLSFGGGGTDPAFFRDGDTTYEHRGGTMRNNVVHRTKDVAIYLNKATDFDVYNNTLWSTFKGADSSIDIRFNSRGAIINNLCSQGYHLRDGGAAMVKYNLTYAPATLFVNQPKGDYHLRASASTARKKGTNLLAAVPTDFDGKARPRHGAFDIGAFQYAGR